jgi:hypothetical protein
MLKNVFKGLSVKSGSIDSDASGRVRVRVAEFFIDVSNGVKNSEGRFFGHKKK